MGRATRVLLVDDHPLFRRGLRSLLEEEANISVVGEASDGQEAIERVEELSPDVLIMDITMPKLNGIDSTRRILSESPKCKIIVLSIHSGKRFVEKMLQAGVSAYILKDNAPEDLVKGIRAVMDGEGYLSQSITSVVLSEFKSKLGYMGDSNKDTALTTGERDALQLLIEGASTKDIASVLRVSVKTVESKKGRIMNKLGVTTMAELTEAARHEGLTGKESKHGAAEVAAAKPIVSTKLHRPPDPTNHVPRSLLLKRFEEARRLPLTLVSAPAGYGKSTLVSHWLKMCGCPSAWVLLDEDDNDLGTFLNYFLAAIEAALPDSIPKTNAMAKQAVLPPISVLVESLVNELDLIEQDFFLALNDFHHIQEKSIQNLLTELLRHPPRSMHLIVISRRDPFLPIASYRALEQVNEIRAQDLRFTKEETARYLRFIFGDEVDESIAAALTERTEGWVTGLRLAAMSIRHRGDISGILPEIHGTTQYAMEYLFDEVLSRQSQGKRDYLLNTAILNRFCAPLCDAVCGPGAVGEPEEIDGWQFIRFLKKEDLFLIKLDSENRWFRYHQMFQQLLQNQLERYRNPGEIATLHSRAGTWFKENGSIEEAIRHSLAEVKIMLAGETAENLDRAAVILDSLHDTTTIQNRNSFLMDVLLLHALLFEAGGDEDSAFVKLTEALKLAKQCGFIRPFLDLGGPMEEMLKRLNAEEALNDYIESVLAAFRAESTISVPDRAPYQVALNQTSASQAHDVDFLSKRESETLALLGQGLSNKEIASTLFLSTETVKKHLYNIYQKLHVNNRVSALSKARVLGLLPPE